MSIVSRLATFLVDALVGWSADWAWGNALDRTDHAHPCLWPQPNSREGSPYLQPNTSKASPQSGICGDSGCHYALGCYLARSGGRYLGCLLGLYLTSGPRCFTR